MAAETDPGLLDAALSRAAPDFEAGRQRLYIGQHTVILVIKNPKAKPGEVETRGVILEPVDLEFVEKTFGEDAAKRARAAIFGPGAGARP